MQPLERLAHRGLFRIGIIVFVAMVILALSAVSARRLGVAASPGHDVPAAAKAAPADDHGAAIRPFRQGIIRGLSGVGPVQ